jgi:spermidine synthase
VRLDDLHRRHIDRLRTLPATIDTYGLRLGDQYTMFFAEAGLMLQHATALTAGHTGLDVLEVGLGLGVFAEAVTRLGIRSYTAVEPHPEVAKLARYRVLDQLTIPVCVHEEPWQLVELPTASFDAIMLDTWPPNGAADDDFAAFVAEVAVPSLRPGGRFSFFHAGRDLNRDRLAVLQRHFRDVQLWHHQIPAEDLPATWTKPTGDFVVPIAIKAGDR